MYFLLFDGHTTLLLLRGIIFLGIQSRRATFDPVSVLAGVHEKDFLKGGCRIELNLKMKES